MYTLKNFCDDIDKLEFKEIHYIFFNDIAPHLLDEIWKNLAERYAIFRQIEAFTGQAKIEAIRAFLNSQKPSPLPTWTYFYTLLREHGYDPEELTLEEALLLISKITKI
jgi:hypothetical protein